MAWSHRTTPPKKAHTSWTIIMTPKDFGGLGIRDLHLMNQTLIMK
jgi:hypothetical protein